MGRSSLVLFRLACALLGAAGFVTLSCDALRVAESSDAGQDSGRGADSSSSAVDGSGDPDASLPNDATSKRRTIEVLASGFTHPLELALDDDTVFFTLEFDQTATVRKVRKDGSGSEIVSPYDAASGLNALGNDIVIVAPDVVWANGTAEVGRIFAAPRAGGVERSLTGVIDSPYHLAFFGGELYFVDQDIFSANPYAIRHAPMDGGTPKSVAAHQSRVGGIAVDSTGVYWTQGGPLAVGKNGVRHQPLGGGPDATADLYVGNDNGEVGGIALGDGEVFWADTEGGRILKVGKSGGITTVLADSLAAPMRLAFDGVHIYFTQQGLTSKADGKVSRVPASGGPVEDLAVALDHPVGIAIDATHVYWAAYGGGEVARTQK